MVRLDGRANDQLRQVRITPGYLRYAEGSALIEMGNTTVLCAVTVEDRVPPFLKGQGRGWVTSEYGMLPRSTHVRTHRDNDRSNGRTHEIQRLIGRSLRAATDLQAIGERTFTVDCDVLQADGGTRTASITSSYVALHQALQSLVRTGFLPTVPLRCAVAATSVGLVDGDALLDLCYEEDLHAEVDFNVVMTSQGEFVELQGTAEGSPFSRESVDALLDMARKGIERLFCIQREALALVRAS